MSVLDRFRLDGKRVLITGGSRGLGKAMAMALAEVGADLLLVSSDAANLAAARDELSVTGRKIDTLQADLYIPEDTERMCRQALSDFGPIDILINNIGGRRQNIATEAMPLDVWQRMMDFNLTSTFLCTRTIGGAMLPRRWGRVINIASICGTIAGRGIYGRHYETAKAAVVGFTRAVAADWAPHGITVNAIAPGGFLTDANRRWFRENPSLKQTFESGVPMGRLGEPEELAPLAVYLASDASSYMTGSVVTIDGGYTAW